MNKLILSAVLLALTACTTIPADTAARDNRGTLSHQNDEAAVRHLMQRYQQAMRQGDLDGIAATLHPDVVTAFQNRLTTQGKAAVLNNYQATFRAMDFGTITYLIGDLLTDGNLAVVYTYHPVGSYVVSKQDKSRHLDHNRELFVLKKEQGQWLIYRYMYNQTPEQAH